MGGSILKDPMPDLQKEQGSRSDCLSAIVIPARLESVRLPNKLLLDKTGKPLVHYAIDNALRSSAADVGLVTDSPLIYRCVFDGFKGRMLALYRNVRAECGSERLAQWLTWYDAWDTYSVVVNLQADEPCIDGRDLDNLIAACRYSGQISTLICPLKREEREDPNCVKAWRRGNIIVDFTRGPNLAFHGRPWLHIGAYAFPQALLKKCLIAMPTSRSRQCKLEQLTWLDAGDKILAVELKHSERFGGINTSQDYSEFVKMKGKRCEA